MEIADSRPTVDILRFLIPASRTFLLLRVHHYGPIGSGIKRELLATRCLLFGYGLDFEPIVVSPRSSPSSRSLQDRGNVTRDYRYFFFIFLSFFFFSIIINAGIGKQSCECRMQRAYARGSHRCQSNSFKLIGPEAESVYRAISSGLFFSPVSLSLSLSLARTLCPHPRWVFVFVRPLSTAATDKPDAFIAYNYMPPFLPREIYGCGSERSRRSFVLRTWIPRRNFSIFLPSPPPDRSVFIE